MIGIGLAADYRVMVAFSFLQQVGAGMSVITLILWITNVIPAEHRGRGMGMWVASFFIGQFASPLVFRATQSVGGSVLVAFTMLGAVAGVCALVAFITRARVA
jgi:MFS family permease